MPDQRVSGPADRIDAAHRLRLPCPTGREVTAHFLEILADLRIAGLRPRRDTQSSPVPVVQAGLAALLTLILARGTPHIPIGTPIAGRTDTFRRSAGAINNVSRRRHRDVPRPGVDLASPRAAKPAAYAHQDLPLSGAAEVQPGAPARHPPLPGSWPSTTFDTAATDQPRAGSRPLEMPTVPDTGVGKFNGPSAHRTAAWRGDSGG